MFNQKPSHTVDYFVLLSVLATTAVAIQVFQFTKAALVLVSLAVSILYVLWGITHHKKAGHIDKKIVLEYVGLALLVNILIITLVL